MILCVCLCLFVCMFVAVWQYWSVQRPFKLELIVQNNVENQSVSPMSRIKSIALMKPVGYQPHRNKIWHFFLASPYQSRWIFKLHIFCVPFSNHFHLGRKSMPRTNRTLIKKMQFLAEIFILCMCVCVFLQLL